MRAFLHTAQAHDEQSVKLINGRDILAAEQANQSAIRYMEESSELQMRFDSNNV